MTTRWAAALLGAALAAGGAAAQPPTGAPTEQEQLEALQRELDRVTAEIERARREREVLRISGFTVDGRGSSCDVLLRLEHAVTGFETVNRLFLTAEVVHGGRATIERVHFEEVALHGTRDARLNLDGRCQAGFAMRILRVDICQIDGQYFGDCGTVLRSSHPVSIAPGATR